MLLWNPWSREPVDPPLVGAADEPLWDVRTRAAVGRPLTGDTDAVSSVAFSPDGELLATAGHDRKVRLWKVAAVRRGWRESGAPASGE